MKKKMERKGWLRSLIAGCMILFILFTCLPADWNLSAGTVYAAGTDGTLAAPDGDADPSGGSMQKGESNRVGADKAAGGEGTAAQTPADERDTAAQNTAAGERDTAAQKEDRARRQIRQLAETVRRKACLNLLQRTQERTDPKHPPRPQQKKVLQARRQAGRTALQKQKTTLLLRQEQERRRVRPGTTATEKPGLYRMPEARRTGTAVPSLRMPPLRMLPLRHPQNPRRKNPG